VIATILRRSARERTFIALPKGLFPSWLITIKEKSK
jgi:hypothetical protein